MTINAASLIAGLSASDSVVRRVKPSTLSECLPGAADYLADRWTRESGVEFSKRERGETAVQIGRETLAVIDGRTAELGLLLASTSSHPDEVTVSANGKTVTARLTVRTDSGASASIAVSFPLDSTFGEALGAVAPRR